MAPPIPTTITEFQVSLSLPPRACWQNSRGSWRAGQADRAAHRDDAYLKTCEALRGRTAPRWPYVLITMHFFWANRGKRDPINAMAAMKQAIDGIVLAGIMADDDQTWPATPTFNYDPAHPRVIVHIAPIPVPHPFQSF